MIGNTKSKDAFHIKDCLREYIIPLDQNVNRNNYFVPEATKGIKETRWGWHSNVLGQFLCPMELKVEFEQDRE